MKLKVFSGSDIVNGKQVSILIAATSIAKAVNAMKECGLHTTAGHIAKYWSVTGNAGDIATAIAQPGTVFASSTMTGHDFKPLANRAWEPVINARPDGTQCALRFRDRLGTFDLPGPHFLHDDGFWYLIDPPTKITNEPTHFKPI